MEPELFLKNGKLIYKLQNIASCLPGFLQQDCKFHGSLLTFIPSFNEYMIKLKDEMEKICISCLNPQIFINAGGDDIYYNVELRHPTMVTSDFIFQVIYGQKTCLNMKIIIRLIISDFLYLKNQCEILGLDKHFTIPIVQFTNKLLFLITKIKIE